MYRQYGVPENQIHLSPLCIDNDRFSRPRSERRRISFLWALSRTSGRCLRCRWHEKWPFVWGGEHDRFCRQRRDE